MMMIPLYRKLFALPWAALLLGLLALHGTLTFGQDRPERFWLAGRYDGDRVIVYFDAVKFAGTLPSNSAKIADPVAAAFFRPIELPASYVTQFQKRPNVEHFALGDLYDLLPGDGTVATIRLTTLVGCETDEGVGNDSFIGALGTLEKKWALVSANNYYVVRRHQDQQAAKAKLKPKLTVDYLRYAHLDDRPVRFDIETRIAELLNNRMKVEATLADRRLADNLPPSFKVQPFRVADGSLRYYVRVEWKSKEPKGTPPYVLGTWMTTRPELRILAVQKRTSPYDGLESELPDVLNVVDLGDGRTGIIVHIAGIDSTELRLVEYRDGADLNGMRLMQSISTGE